MSKLNLNEFSDEDIIKAFYALPARKFVSVLNAMAMVSKKLEQRGSLLAERDADEIVNRLIKEAFEGES